MADAPRPHHRFTLQPIRIAGRVTLGACWYYPFQTTQYLANIVEGIEPNTGTTTSGTATQSAPNLLNSIVGGGLGLAGLYQASDRRLKEDIKPIGKTYDGQTMYRFRYKGDPMMRVGLMAQDVEKQHPHAVARSLGDMRMVDYDAATEKAAKKGHFAAGGGVGLGNLGGMPYSTGTGYVPVSSGIPAAHAQTPSLNMNQGLGAAQTAGSMQTPGMQNMMAGAKLFNNSSLGDSLHDSVTDGMDDLGSSLGFARGGNVVGLGAARMRRHYDGGGVVPDADSMIFDPTALATGTDGGASFSPGISGTGSTAFQPNTPADGTTVNVPLSQQGLGAAALASYGNPSTWAPQGLGAASALAPSSPQPDLSPAGPVSMSNPPTWSNQGLGAAAGPAASSAPSGLGAAAMAPTANDNTTSPDTPSTSTGGLGLAATPANAAPTALGAINTAAAPSGQVGSGFNGAVSRTMGFEGGYNPSDANGSPSNFGINQAANPDVDVSKLSPDQAKAIYKTRYWDAIGGDKLPPALARVAFDTAVIAGPAKAQELISQSGGDASKFMDLRQNYLDGLVAANPQKYGQYAKSWSDRDAALRSDINGGSAPSDALGYSAQAGANAASGTLGAAANGGLGAASTSAPGGLGAASTSSPSFLSNLGSLITTGKPLVDTGGLGGVLPKMSPEAGLGLMNMGAAMMASPSRNFGMAVGQGAQAGLKGYQEARKLTGDQALQHAQVQNIGSEIGNRTVLQGQGQQHIQLALQELQRQLELARSQVKNDTQRTANDTARTIPEVAARNAETATKLQTPTPPGLMVRDPSDPSNIKLIPWSKAVSNGDPNAPVTPGATAPAATAGGTGGQPSPSVSAPSPASTGRVPLPANIPTNPMMFSSDGQKMAFDNSKATMDDARPAYEASQNTKMYLGEMQHDLAQLPATGLLAQGPGQAQRAAFGNKINAVAHSIGFNGDLYDPKGIAATEDIGKISKKMGFELSRGIGGKEPGFIVQQAVSTVPSSDNSPMGVQRLIAGIQSMAQRNEDRYNFLTDWGQRSGGDLTGADDAFNKASPPQKYVAQAVLSSIDPRAVTKLRSNPSMAAAFDQKYGVGTSRYALGQ